MQSIRFIIFSRIFLVVMAYSALLAVVGFIGISTFTRQFVVEDAKSSLSSVINNLRANYFVQLHQLDDMAAMAGFAPFDPAASGSLVDQFLKFPGIIGTIHVYEPDGDLLYAKRQASIPPYRYDRNFHVKPQREFLHLAQKVLKEKRPAVSETFYTSRGDLLQTYIVPILPPGSDGPAVGIISGGVFPLRHRLDHLVEGLTLAEGNFIVVTDTKGNAVAKSSLPPEANMKGLRPFLGEAMATFMTASKGKPGMIHVTAVDERIGEPYILISGIIPEMKLLVTLGVNTHLIKHRQADIVKYVALLLVCGLVFTALAAVMVGNRLSQPLIEIFNVLKQLAVGDLTARVSYTGNDEIGYLGELINRLGSKIRKDRYLGELWSTDDEATTILDEAER